MMYLAEKAGKLYPEDWNKRSEVNQWMYFMNGGYPAPQRVYAANWLRCYICSMSECQYIESLVSHPKSTQGRNIMCLCCHAHGTQCVRCSTDMPAGSEADLTLRTL